MKIKQRAGEVVLIRHAQSEWNRENRLTGWADPTLSEAGIAEAHRAGRLLRETGYRFDHGYTSRLQRAHHTLAILLHELGQTGLATRQEWRLNERHYGALQGLNKGEIARQVGTEQLHRWCRGYLDLPPPLHPDDARHPANDPLHADLPAEWLPRYENLDQTRNRVMHFWSEQVVPRMARGERLLLSAHGNTLRALIMALDGMSAAEVEQLAIPTAAPILYRFDDNGVPQGWHYLEALPCIGCAA